MSTIDIKTPEDVQTLWPVASGDSHTFRFHRYKVNWLELEDSLFHFDSAVMMPDGVDSEGRPAQDRISGLSAIRATYMHAQDNSDQKLLIAGHTDSSGPDSYNETLSLQRAEMVLHIIEGNSDGFVKIARAKHVTRDYEQILRWVALWLTWDCDPGIVDDVRDEQSKEAVKTFQRQYSKAEFGKSISVDGIVGKQTWTAFFHLYMRRLAELLDTDEAGLGEWRTKINWLYSDLKFVGSGEYHPVNESYRSDHKSQSDRRIELLFYEPGEEPSQKPGKICHTGGLAGVENCPIYNPLLYDFTYLVPKALDIKTLDSHFAPKAESLEIHYRLEGLSDETITLEITSPHYKDGVIYSQVLGAEEKGDGNHIITWDGKTTCAAGDLKDLYINPLYSPYKVRLHNGGKYTDSATFRVLYHSLSIHQDTWTPDAKEPTEEKAWVQFKLNELGYFGGPVGKDFDNYLKKAVIRYKANHKAMHELNFDSYDDSISDKLKKALKKGDNKRAYLTGAAFTDPNKESQIRVEALTYEGDEFRGSYTDASKSKFTKESERLSRPLIPVCVQVYVKTKNNTKVLVPEAVGAVRVNWVVTDSHEDLTKLPGNTATEPSLTQKYVEKSLKLKSGRISTNGDNCHKDFGGIRDVPAQNWSTPGLVGDKLEGYTVEKDNANKKLFTKACIDKVKYPKRLGKAGFFFRPSNVAGDVYKIRAEIDFVNLANEADLKTAHGIVDEASRIQIETGTFRIQRFNRIALLINWPARSVSNPWAQIKAEFASAYLDVDVSSIISKKITEVISEKDYKKIVAKNTSHKESDVKLLDNSMIGVKLPKQGSMTAGQYKTALNTFCVTDYWRKIRDDLSAKISEKVRKSHPIGFIVIDFLSHAPIDIQSAPPGNTTVSPAHRGYINWTGSVGQPDSVVLIDQKDPDKIYYVVAHEMGHNFWLKHWEHAGGSRAADHDQDDHNCIMSYSNSGCAHAHHRPGSYTPHFCGQCNLKLRGWNINRASIPADSK